MSNFTRAASGHCYFNLKDAGAQVRCVFFRQKAQFLDFALKDGLQVEVRVSITVFVRHNKGGETEAYRSNGFLSSTSGLK